MQIQKEEVISRIKKAKEYGLSYSKIAREVGVQPVTMYMFINGTYNLSKQKQIQVLIITGKYIEQVQQQLAYTGVI